MNAQEEDNFEVVILGILKRLSRGMNEQSNLRLKSLGERLLGLHENAETDLTQSVMELICARELIVSGYMVNVEYSLDSNLTCDVHAVKGEGVLIIKVETGDTPPIHALNPNSFSQAKISSKISRYSPRASKFGLATPNSNILQVPYLFIKPPRDRSEEEVERIRRLCDKLYPKPPLSFDQIKDARLHSIVLIDIDHGHTREIDPETYQELQSRVDGLVTYSWKWKDADADA
ncbi:MAG: hypothetical protein O7B30_03720 [Thaumarchaeota archaeon]|nr:hypothetical protein [Nitrososphaerota archaeon]